MGALEDVGFSGGGMGGGVEQAPVSVPGDGYVVDELIDLEISALRDQGDGSRIFKDTRDTAQKFLGGQVSDPLIESQMIDYVTNWMIEQGKVRTPQDVVRLLAHVDEFTGSRSPAGQRLLLRAYLEAVKHGNAKDRTRDRAAS